MSQLVRVSPTSFADYVNVAGTKRSTIIGQQVDRYRDPGRTAWWAYLAAERGCLAALAAADPRPVLDAMVAGAPPNMTRHYPLEAMLPGATPVVLDVRRGRLIAMPRRTDRTRLDGLMAGETAGYRAHWQAVAA